MKGLFQIGFDDLRIQGGEARVFGNSSVEMDKALDNDISLTDAVRALLSLAVDESEVGSRKIMT